MRKNAMNAPGIEPRPDIAAGFSVPELLIVVTLITIVSSLAILSFQKSTKDFKVAGAMRTLSTYLEKARLDSVRRHGGASININSATSYTVNIDFDGSGTATSRTITLPEGTSLSYTLPPAAVSANPSTNPIIISYDWRGRATNIVALTLTESTSGVRTNTVVVGSTGDISADTSVTGPVATPTPQVQVATTTGIKSMR
jgi:prepilin-type N-terminal cleavage/methylation domain-containing protein